jgi:drug/metabolite transporter (DMT)-like permease
VLVLHDRLTWPFLLGALVILAGILLVNARDLIARGRRGASTIPVPITACRSRP